MPRSNRLGGSGHSFDERNYSIVTLRRAVPSHFTFRKLGEIFSLDEKTVHEIWRRDKGKYSKEIIRVFIDSFKSAR